MAHISEMKFGDLQTEQRYKKLERILKIASLKKGIRRGDDSWLSHTSPSISSINTDQFHSTNTPCLQDFNIGSEIVSSSNNLRNIFSQRKSTSNNHKMIATSSVKKFSEESDCQTDHLVMPPPILNRVLRSSKRSDCSTTYNLPNASPTIQNERPSPTVNNDSLKIKQSYKSSNNSEKYIDAFSSLQTPDNCSSRGATVFTKWKVMLKEQSQLVIKGIVDCGKIARSKPIVRRLTSTTVESVSQHLYCLHGNIVDDKCELPDYIKGKFYNGFPDDWENVCEIWKTFVQQGCSKTFRWPTPITDSDDDLKSEVTDITHIDSPEDEIPNFKSSKESRASGALVYTNCTNCSYNTLKTKNKQSFKSSNYKKRDSFTQTNISDTSESSLLQASIQPSKKWNDNDKENCIHQKDINLDWSDIKNERNGLKDKLNVFINNLTNKNCSQECISKVIEMFDCLNYVVSCSSSKEHKFHTKSSRSEEYRKRDRSSSEYCHSESFPLENNTITETAGVLRKKRTFAEMNEANSSTSSDSENEVYAGTPKISMKGMIRQKSALINPYKRKLKKERVAKKERYTLNTFRTTSDWTKENYRKTRRAKSTNSVDFEDSSISIIEDERNDFVKLQSNDEYVKSDSHTKPHKMQEHFVKENSAVTRKHFCPPYDIIENEEHASNLPEKRTRETRDVSLSENTDNERNSESIKDQYKNHLSRQQYQEVFTHSENNKNRISKPVIISTVPVDINIIKEMAKSSPKKKKLNAIVLKGKTIEELSEETKHENVLKGDSPKKSDAIRKNNLNALTDSNGYSNKNNSAMSKMLSPTNLKLLENKKAKLLSAWTPKVLYDSELQLIFKGNLLNEIGHVVHKKFTTDKVVQRISSKLIETADHEFYELIGDLHDTKHVVPKELLNQCRYGCPNRIKQFCEKWKSLESAGSSNHRGVMKKSNDTLSTNVINVPTSSKGRKIIPPLSYWTGERVIVKEDSVIYKPGNSSDYSMLTYGSPDKGKNMKKLKNREIKDGGKTARILHESEVPITTKESYNFITIRDANREINTSISPSKQMSGNDQSSTETYRNLICKYYQGIPVKDDILSDDQISHV